MFKAIKHPALVPYGGSFRCDKAATKPPPDAPDDKTCKKRLSKHVKALDALQRILYAHDNHAVLLVFQAMDAAGKDSTIRAVLSGIDPAGCQVYSFKSPSDEDLDHDFLWRTARCLPEKGRIGVFNRSYYEEVLIVRVHPEYLGAQKLPDLDLKTVWAERLESIADHEKHLARNGMVILKFWLNVSRDEQRKRFLSRLREPEKHWKFNTADVHEREHWDQYMAAYEAALNATSKPWAPWYSIPADNKAYMRMTVADIILQNLNTLDLHYPVVDKKSRARFKEIQKYLEKGG